MTLRTNLTMLSVLAALSTSPCYAAPRLAEDSRASLRFQESGEIKINLCKVSLKKCLIESVARQSSCLAETAADKVCEGSSASYVLIRRAHLESQAQTDMGLQKCVKQLDAEISAWLMSSDSNGLDAADKDSKNDLAQLLTSLKRCEALSKTWPTE